MIFLGLEIAAVLAAPIIIQKGIEIVKNKIEDAKSPIIKNKA